MQVGLRDELRHVAQLLKRHGYVERATFLDDLANRRDDEEVLTMASGLELWGGSGAVWEVEPFANASDHEQFQRGMMRIAEMLEAAGRGQLARRNAALSSDSSPAATPPNCR